jgi:hypothetical protein
MAKRLSTPLSTIVIVGVVGKTKGIVMAVEQNHRH